MTETGQMTPAIALEKLQSAIGDNSLFETVKRRQLGSELDEVRAVLRGGKRHLDSAGTLGKVAKLVGEVDADTLRAVGAPIERLGAAARALRKAETPDDLRDWRRVHWDRLEEAVDELTHLLTAAWKENCAAPFGEHERLGAVLARFRETKALGREMQKTAQAGRALGSSFPPTPQSRTALENAVERAAKERQKVSDLGLSDDIAKLLLAAAENRATLADLTPEAMEWLRTSDALSLFELRLAGGPVR